MAIVPDRIRQKLWKILIDAYENYAARNGLAFVAPPSEARSEDGLLADRYRGHNVTHANGAYGRLYLGKLAERAYMSLG